MFKKQWIVREKSEKKNALEFSMIRKRLIKRVNEVNKRYGESLCGYEAGGDQATIYEYEPDDDDDWLVENCRSWPLIEDGGYFQRCDCGCGPSDHTNTRDDWMINAHPMAPKREPTYSYY